MISTNPFEAFSLSVLLTPADGQKDIDEEVSPYAETQCHS
jgi:hypothetical protein